MKIRQFSIVVLVIGLLVCTSWIASPYWASYRIHSALKNNDAALLASYIHFPAVRQSLQPQVEQHLKQRFGDPSSQYFWGRWQQKTVQWVSEQLVNWVVSPAGILLILQGKAGYESEIWQASSRYIQQFAHPVEQGLENFWQKAQRWMKGEDTTQQSEDRVIEKNLKPLQVETESKVSIPKFESHYQNLDQFQFTVPYEQQSIQVIMQREKKGWSWQITAIQLPVSQNLNP